MSLLTVLLISILYSCEEDQNSIVDLVVKDYDGNQYKTIQIGEQIWMEENLKTTHYADGTIIQLVEDGTAWHYLEYTDKAMCYYDNSTANGDTYGALYTWAVAMNGAASSSANPSRIQGACPDGWHLPSEAEWTELTDYLNGNGDAGGKMKETGTIHWLSPNAYATNESGFTALPAGFRNNNGTFLYKSSQTNFWCATETTSPNEVAKYYILRYNYGNVLPNSYGSKEEGRSVRCVKD